jgi:SNF2 family DNA or RNA helicase
MTTEPQFFNLSIQTNKKGCKQTKLYGTIMKEIPWVLRKKIELGLAPDRRELDKLIPFLTGARMISNGTYGFEKNPSEAVSPKINKAFEYLKSNIDKDKDYKALVYSNYLDSGVNPYKKMLDEAKIPYGEFSGAVKDSVRNKLVQDYNANKIRALLVSSAGGEGLDLKGTRLVQLLEPHFNNEKLKQVIGRAARYKSHESLSPEHRNVLVQHYLSEISPSLIQRMMREKSTSTDEYLQNLANEKEKLNNKFLDIIKSGSFLPPPI